MKGLDSNQISDKSKEAVYAITYTSWNSEIVGTLLEETTKELLKNGVDKKNILQTPAYPIPSRRPRPTLAASRRAFSLDAFARALAHRALASSSSLAAPGSFARLAASSASCFSWSYVASGMSRPTNRAVLVAFLSCSRSFSRLCP